MKKWNLIIDIALCEDCNNCFLTCKDEHVDNDWPGYTLPQPRHGHRWMNIKRCERGQYPLIDVAYRPTPCMHCDNAPCVKAAENNAVYKRRDGIVMIDPKKAVGQKQIVDACPYNAIWWNPDTNLPQKCTLCAHLLDDGWEKTRCVQACPTGALKIVKIDDIEMKKRVKSERLEVLKPQLKTLPRVYYKNLYRFTKCFIAGSLAQTKKGVTDCIAGASVTLTKESNIISKTKTDSFGDFKIDGLDKNSGVYTLQITHPKFDGKGLDLEVKSESLNLGTIMLAG